MLGLAEIIALGAIYVHHLIPRILSLNIEMSFLLEKLRAALVPYSFGVPGYTLLVRTRCLILLRKARFLLIPVGHILTFHDYNIK